jgi:Mycobacterial 4 TMS phage holin, superfamily IV
MIRFLLRTLIFLGSAALGLIIAAAVIPGVTLSWSGSLIAVAVFAIAQSILAPFIAKAAARNAPAFLGGIGIVSTFVALFIATLFPGGLQISGLVAWLLAPIVVWLVTALATWLLPMLILRDAVKKRRSESGIPGV